MNRALSDCHEQTTKTIPELLRAKYPADRYALFFEVPDAVSLDARRRIDAVAVGIWKSVGRNISGFEFKTSRSDWLRELRQVDKADPFIAVCDYFWLVTFDTSIAKIDEIPACWGWMSGTPNGLRVQRPATKLPRDKDTLPWAFTVGLLRKLQDDLMASPDVRVRIREIEKSAKEEVDRRVARAVANMRENKQFEQLRQRVEKFEQAAGVTIDSYDAGAIGHIVASILNLNWSDREHGINFIAARLEDHAQQAETLAKQAREAAAQMRGVEAVA